MTLPLQDQIKACDLLSENEIEEMRKAGEDYDRVYRYLREYVRCRFMLVDEDYWSDDLKQLSEYSIRKLVRLQADEPLHDISMTCTGASSTSTRKVLLLIAIQKKLGFRFDYAESPEIETIPQLARAIIKHRRYASSISVQLGEQDE